MEVVNTFQNLLDILPDQTLTQGASQGVDGKNLAKLPGKVTIFGCWIQFKLGALQFSMMPAYSSIEVVDSADLYCLFQEIPAKAE
jgi:hypothetical protein